MAVEVVANYKLVGIAFVNKARCKTASKRQGHNGCFFVIRVILKAVLQYKVEVLHFKKCMWALCVEIFKRKLSCKEGFYLL